MGIVSTTLSQSNNMKFLLVLAVAAYARAEAEAKPGFAYTTGHLPLAYGYHPYAVHHPLVYTAPVGCQNNEGVAVPCAHGVFPYGLVPAVAAPAAAEAEDDAVVSVEKREAEPTAEADLKLTLRLTHGCTTTDLATLLIPMVMVTMVWDTAMAMLGMDMVIIWAMLGIMVIIWDWDTTARGPPRLSQLLRLMLRLPQRLTHGCTTTVLVMPLILMDTVTLAIIWVILLMLDITRTLTTEQAAEMATEPWFPVPPGNSVEVSALVY